MNTRALVISMLLAFFAVPCLPQQQPTPVAANRIQLQLNTEESEAVLAIVANKRARRPVSDTGWQRLLTSEPYVRLKAHDEEMNAEFSDDSFKNFVNSPKLAAQAPQLQRTLEQWKRADMGTAATRVLSYLPPEARIRAKIFPIIKPKDTSFVYQLKTDPTIFLYLNPEVTQQQFENRIAHELHHIGYASVAYKIRRVLAEMPPNVRPAVEWMGAFGEGFAMLAAAGGPEVHPHRAGTPEDRARWDNGISNFNRDLRSLDRFFMDVIDGEYSTRKDIQNAALSFFGVEGPWYTVGYKMAVTIENRYGRAALVECMMDPRKLLRRYNLAASAYNLNNADKLALWSNELMVRVGSQYDPEPEPDGGGTNPPRILVTHLTPGATIRTPGLQTTQ